MVLTDRDNEIIIYGYDTVRDMERAWRDIMRALIAIIEDGGVDEIVKRVEPFRRKVHDWRITWEDKEE